MGAVVELPKHGVWPCANHEYHEDRTAESSSTLKVFAEFPARYHAIYVAGTIMKPQPTAAMRLGSLVHSMVLEPDTVDDEYAVAPECDRRTKSGKEAYSRFEMESVLKTIVDRESYDTARAMADAALAHPEVKEILRRPGVREQAIRWRDPVTGIQLKAKPDFFSFDAPTIDLKSSNDPHPTAWSRAIYQHDYHVQAALYRQGIEAVYRVDTPFVNVVIGSEPPHEVIVYQLDSQALELGRQRLADILASLKRCRDTDQWGTHYPGIQLATLPGWAFTQRD